MRQIIIRVLMRRTLIAVTVPQTTLPSVMSPHLQGAAGRSVQFSSVLREQGYAQHEGKFIYTRQNPALHLDEGPCVPRMMDSAAYTVVTIAVG